jgi:uncharacterized protein with PQ loop repeat
MFVEIIGIHWYKLYRKSCGYSMVTYTKFTYMPVDILWLHTKKFTDMLMDILWLHIRSLQTCLWIFCGYIYEVYRNAYGYSVVTYTKFTDIPVDILWLEIYEVSTHACEYSVVTYTKFTDMPMDILWLHTWSLQTCLWIFCGYIHEVYRHAYGYSVVTVIRSIWKYL